MSDDNQNEIEMEPFNEKKNDENSNETNENSCKNQIAKFLESHLFHKLVVLFVVIDCLCVSLEFTLDSIEKHFTTNHEIN